MAPNATATAQKRREDRADARREHILDAALEVFAESGYANATTKKIAETAGLRSPGLLYWYFDSKEALLRETFLRYAVVLDSTVGDDPPLDIPPEIALPAVAKSALEVFADDRVRRIYRLWMAEWPRLEELGVSLRGAGRTRTVYSATESYLSRQIELGTLREHDSAIAARMFVSLVWTQAEARYLFPSIYPEPPDDDRYVDTIVEVFLNGLRAKAT